MKDSVQEVRNPEGDSCKGFSRAIQLTLALPRLQLPTPIAAQSEFKSSYTFHLGYLGIADDIGSENNKKTE